MVNVMPLSEVQIKQAMNDILEPVKNVKITLRESIFVKEILPMLVSDMDREIVIGRWLEICKSPYFSVDIVDNDNEYLFTVPPLWIKQTTRTDYDGRYSFDEIMTRTQLRSEISPKQGDIFFEECSEHLLPTSIDEKDYGKMWDNIFIRYGYMKKDENREPLEEEFEFE